MQRDHSLIKTLDSLCARASTSKKSFHYGKRNRERPCIICMQRWLHYIKTALLWLEVLCVQCVSERCWVGSVGLNTGMFG